MRTLIAWTLTLAIGAWAADSARAQGNQAPPKRPAQQPPAAAKPAQQPPVAVDANAARARLDAEFKAREEMNQLLAEWEKQSKKVVSLDVVFDRIDKSEGWGNQYYQGLALLQSPDLACLEFRKYKLDANGKPIAQLEPDPFERIVCTGNEVLQYSWDDRKIFVFPLDKEVRQKTLQQGPLPFLFNMKAADAKDRYTMSIQKQDDKEYLIGIVPKKEIDKESFSYAFLWLSKETFLPNQLWLIPVGSKDPLKDHQEFRFTGNKNKIKPNAPIDMKLFTFRQIPDWKVIVNPGGDAAAAPANPGKAVGQGVKRPAPQPAMRPTPRPQ